MPSTKRSQNKCSACGYTWYPKGHYKSLKCPSCGSSNVSVAGGGWLLFGLLLVGWFLFADKDESPKARKETIPHTVATQASKTSSAANTVPISAVSEPALPVPSPDDALVSKPEATEPIISEARTSQRVEPVGSAP